MGEREVRTAKKYKEYTKVCSERLLSMKFESYEICNIEKSRNEFANKSFTKYSISYNHHLQYHLGFYLKLINYNLNVSFENH